ncbi:MAG TPA: NAD(P)/FAD-dependent oxidoreductase [Longimicrobiales bacterium]
MPRTAEVDAIIVGAGPAGATTALLLARAGHEVVLLDRHRFPRAKPCGDCLSAGATHILERLGLLAAVQAARPANLTGWRIVAPDGASFFARFGTGATGPRTALSLARERFDALLVDAARAHGATLRAPFRVTGLVPSRTGRVLGVRGRAAGGEPAELHARLVIGADGLRSIVARRLRLLRRAPRLRKFSLTTHIRGPAPHHGHGEMHLAPGACLGIAPVTAPASDDPGRVDLNVTLVADADRFADDVARGATRFFRTMLERFPLRPLDGHAAALADESLHLMASGPFDWPTRDTIAHRAALVGDAAGYYDPFTGQGIHHALASAEILAEEADAALRDDDLSANRLRRYARRRAALLRGTRTLQRTIETVTARPRLANFAIRRLADAPAAAEALIAATADLRRPASLLRPGPLLALLFARAIPTTAA